MTVTRTRAMFSVLAVVLITLGVAVVLIFTPSAPENRSAGGAAPAVADLNLPLVQLEGQWFAKDGENSFVATISGENIEIQLSLGGDMSALYWHGTFKTAESAGSKIVSVKTEQPDEIVLSQDPTKEFTVNQNELVFKFSALGFTKSIAMTR